MRNEESRVGHNGGPPLDWSDYGGFTVEARDSWKHPIVGYGQPVKPADASRGSFSKNEAWRDLIRGCRYADGHVMNGGRKMALLRGELIGAVSWLANRWNWTPKTVRVYLDRLESDGMISRFTRGPDGSETLLEKGNQIGNRAAVVRVSNYKLFNPGPASDGEWQGQSRGNQGSIEGQSRGNSINKETIEKDDSAAECERPVGQRAEMHNGEIRLFNGLKAEWVSEFGGDEPLRLALKQVAGYVQENSLRPLEVQVSSQLARMLREKRDRDARYAAAAAAPKSRPTTSQPQMNYASIARRP